MRQVFIDKIVIPKNSIPQVMERLDYNTSFLEKQPGLIENMHYEGTDEQGNVVVITVATWENAQAVERAKAAVQADYQRLGINLTEKLKEWGVTMDRGLYQIREKYNR
ncbi:hypothetical protein [Mucilaginibacter sp. L3T2-6]|uniref:hypothetical protein n=1 Tax=Mucilaginibacter sp. L3T2-6 TaxID=3062491 RepID=UPI002676D266|nr:hypothetical protein [Mucilaginibacter sp. L3T2-6]MDO3642805.1 hypothetical protein [Mucilaginibacter sp. L3T2-6]MDV6215454.1 hypothetical protein [Mucilaginibacter sp. L3T2-6]